MLKLALLVSTLALLATSSAQAGGAEGSPILSSPTARTPTAAPQPTLPVALVLSEVRQCRNLYGLLYQVELSNARTAEAVAKSLGQAPPQPLETKPTERLASLLRADLIGCFQRAYQQLPSLKLPTPGTPTKP